MGSQDPDFTCAICRRLISMRWSRTTGYDAVIAPICRCCEGEFSRGVGRPMAGSLMDRRIVMRGFAVTEALHTAAAHRKWGGVFGQP